MPGSTSDGGAKKRVKVKDLAARNRIGIAQGNQTDATRKIDYHV